jgi:hypothetical protein
LVFAVINNWLHSGQKIISWNLGEAGLSQIDEVGQSQSEEQNPTSYFVN